MSDTEVRQCRIRTKRTAGTLSCEADFPPSRCQLFQLRPPSGQPVVSGSGPDVNTAPAFVSAPPPQETSPVWPLHIPKHAYLIATDGCRALQSRANISQELGGSGKTSEGGLVFWVWFEGVVAKGNRRVWAIRIGSSCPAAPKVCWWRHVVVVVHPWFRVLDERFLLSTTLILQVWIRKNVEQQLIKTSRGKVLLSTFTKINTLNLPLLYFFFCTTVVLHFRWTLWRRSSENFKRSGCCWFALELHLGLDALLLGKLVTSFLVCRRSTCRWGNDFKYFTRSRSDFFPQWLAYFWQ